MKTHTTYPTKHGEARPHDCRHMGCQSDVRVDVHIKITHSFHCWNRRVANGHQSNRDLVLTYDEHHITSVFSGYNFNLLAIIHTEPLT